jgi:hypothetical protein
MEERGIFPENVIWGPPGLQSNGFWWLFLSGKAADAWTWPSPGITSTWRCVSSPSHIFIMWRFINTGQPYVWLDRFSLLSFNVFLFCPFQCRKTMYNLIRRYIRCKCRLALRTEDWILPPPTKPEPIWTQRPFCNRPPNYVRNVWSSQVRFGS